MSIYRFNMDTMQFECDGVPLDNVKVRLHKGRYYYRGVDTGRLFGSGMSPKDFAARFWYVTPDRWQD